MACPDQLPLFPVREDRLGVVEVDARLRAAALERASRAANSWRRSSTELSRAVEIAVEAGFTWRQIGRATGLPHQTLHRRSKAAKERASHGVVTTSA